MKFFVELAVELPDGHSLKRNDNVGDLKIRRLHKPNPRNAEAGFRVYDIAEIDGKMDARRSSTALIIVLQLLQEIGLDEKAMIDLSVHPVD